MAIRQEGREYSVNWGGARPGGGRPKGSTTGRKVYANINVSCSPEDKEKILKAADNAEISISQYILRKVL